MHFVTRERIHVDRIATAWAIRRFVDPAATFEFVSRSRDLRSIRGIPFDIRGAELSHRQGRCTLEALIEKYKLADPALARMALLVRAVDLPHESAATPDVAGLLAVFNGIREGCDSDGERLERGSIVCDALYEYCRSPGGEGGT
jgi:hypothetical protein